MKIKKPTSKTVLRIFAIGIVLAIYIPVYDFYQYMRLRDYELERTTEEYYTEFFQRESYADIKKELKLINKPPTTSVPVLTTGMSRESWIEQFVEPGERLLPEQEAWQIQAIYAYDDFDQEMLQACQVVIKEITKAKYNENVFSTGFPMVEIYLNEERQWSSDDPEQQELQWKEKQRN